MSKTYSAHPAKAWEQLQCAELAKDQHNNNNNNNNNIIKKNNNNNATKTTTTTIQHRRHNHNNSAINLTNCENVCCKQNLTPTALHEVLDVTLQQQHTNKTLPDRTATTATTTTTTKILHRTAEEDVSTIACDYAVIDEDDLSDSITKDCVNCENYEPDVLRTNTALNALDRRTQSTLTYPAYNRHYHLSSQHLARDMDIVGGCASCDGASGSVSGMSSTISSPSASTVSTPLSTPTRLTPHHQVQPTVTSAAAAALAAAAAAASAANCVNTGAAGSATVKTITAANVTSRETTANNMPKQQQQQRQHYLNRHHPASSANSGCKKQQKFDPRVGPSPYRQLLPIALCILSFACVFTVLIFHMDMTGEST